MRFCYVGAERLRPVVRSGSLRSPIEVASNLRSEDVSNIQLNLDDILSSAFKNFVSLQLSAGLHHST